MYLLPMVSSALLFYILYHVPIQLMNSDAVDNLISQTQHSLLDDKMS